MFLTFFVAQILTWYLAFYLTFFLAFFPAFYLACRLTFYLALYLASGGNLPLRLASLKCRKLTPSTPRKAVLFRVFKRFCRHVGVTFQDPKKVENQQQAVWHAIWYSVWRVLWPSTLSGKLFNIYICVISCIYIYIVLYIYTMWGPPVVSWFINPINYS